MLHDHRNIFGIIDCENAHLKHFDERIIAADSDQRLEHFRICDQMDTLIENQRLSQEAEVYWKPSWILSIDADALKHSRKLNSNPGKSKARLCDFPGDPRL